MFSEIECVPSLFLKRASLRPYKFIIPRFVMRRCLFIQIFTFPRKFTLFFNSLPLNFHGYWFKTVFNLIIFIIFKLIFLIKVNLFLLGRYTSYCVGYVYILQDFYWQRLETRINRNFKFYSPKKNFLLQLLISWTSATTTTIISCLLQNSNWQYFPNPCFK